MKHAIIGAAGGMGTALSGMLEPYAGELIAADRESDDATWENVWNADVIWLSIPRSSVEELLRERHLDASQVVVDICSIKRGIHSVIKATGASHLCLHPLHGASVPLTGQRWAYIPTDDNESERAQEVRELLKEIGITIFPARSEEHHDFMLGVTLSMPEVFTFFIEEGIRSYVRQNEMDEPDAQELMRWVVPASNALYGAYHHIINSTPEWLRKELIKNAYDDLWGSMQTAADRFATMSQDDLDKRVEEQTERIEEIPAAERQRISRWINEWYVDSTKTFFKQEQETKTKPDLTIQWSEEPDNIFPSERTMRVGVHGIDGCFTQEALERFMEEQDVPADRVEPHFLITAKKVLDAVEQGDIEYGIFGVANSGSGAYVTSMFPMGSHRYRVHAIFGMEIMQCLMAHPDATEDSIEEVFGHPQAVSQCKRTLAEHYPDLKMRYGTDDDDTALSAKNIADGTLPDTTATLASQIAAKRYGLKILSYNMQHDPFNTTTFILVGSLDNAAYWEK